MLNVLGHQRRNLKKGPANRKNRKVILCIMLDGARDNLNRCSKFKSLSVVDHLVEVNKFEQRTLVR